MYKIDTVSQKMLDDYFNRYAKQTKDYMTKLLNGDITIPKELGRTKKVLIKLKVKKGSPTWLFLDKYVKDEYLRKLLCGSWNELLEVVSDVENWIPDLKWKYRATKGGFEKGEYQTDEINNCKLIDHFNEILRWLFVNQMYETNLNKLHFIEQLRLKICPYCGRQHINVARFPGYRSSKPNIDHFLPKSLYPFLAISFRNLIPCCSVCNEISNKGDFDPLKPTVGLYNPYEFDDNGVTFIGSFNGTDEQDENSYDVDIKCNSTTLSHGYKEVLKLLTLYKQERLKVQDIYINFTTNTQGHKSFLKDLGVSQDFLEDNARMIIGHPLDGKASQREFYKFKRDLFLQLVKKYKIKEHTSNEGAVPDF